MQGNIRRASVRTAVLVHEDWEWVLKSGSEVLRGFGPDKPRPEVVSHAAYRIGFFERQEALMLRHSVAFRFAYRGILPLYKQIGNEMGGFDYVRGKLPNGNYMMLERSTGGMGGLGIGWDSDDPRKGNLVRILRMKPDNHTMEFVYSEHVLDDSESESDSSWGPSRRLVQTPVKTYKNVSNADLAKVFTRQTGIRL